MVFPTPARTKPKLKTVDNKRTFPTRHLPESLCNPDESNHRIDLLSKDFFFEDGSSSPASRLHLHGESRTDCFDAPRRKSSSSFLYSIGTGWIPPMRCAAG